MGEGEDVMVAHEGEAVVLGRNEHLTSGVLDATLACGGIDELVVIQIVGCNDVVEFVDYFLMLIVSKLRVMRLAAKFVELIQNFSTWPGEFIFFFHMAIYSINCCLLMVFFYIVRGLPQAAWGHAAGRRVVASSRRTLRRRVICFSLR